MKGYALRWDVAVEPMQARHFFEQAIALDPDYGLAHAAFSLVAAWLSQVQGNSQWELAGVLPGSRGGVVLARLHPLPHSPPS